MMFYCWDSEPKERPSFTQLVKVMFEIMENLSFKFLLLIFSCFRTWRPS